MNNTNNEQDITEDFATERDIFMFLQEIGRDVGVSFIDIVDKFGKGTYELSNKNNVLYWNGLTKNTCESISSLLNKKRILLYPTSILSYIIDGQVMQLPVAKNPTTYSYKTPHWAPAVLWTTVRARTCIEEGDFMANKSIVKMYRKDGYDI